MSVIIDRRLNERNKSAANRARFMRRYKRQIRRAVTDMVGERSIRDMEGGGEVSIPANDIAEPRWRHGTGGERETVLPGNREFESGDRLKRPRGGRGRGGKSDGGEGEDGEDGFAFTLSREEFMDIFFDELELPNLLRTEVGDISEPKPQRAGYTSDGAPVNLSVVRTMRQALGRRIALSAGARRRLAELEAEASAESESNETGDPPGDDEVRAREAAGGARGGTGRGAASKRRPDDGERVDPGPAAPTGDAATCEPDAARDEEIAELRRRIERVPFLDEIDLRYRHRVMVPRPVSQAVMFCLMDVSASMDEHRKDLAKRFFTLLYLFLSRKYERVEIVFVRHTDNAEEVDEERFFHDRKTGGTVVLSALTLMSEIVKERFPTGEWNVYGAQASDGDAFGVDPERSRAFLESDLLPVVRHFAYIEVSDRSGGGLSRAHRSTLGSAYARIEDERFAMREVSERRDIYPVFRELFSRSQTGEGASGQGVGGGRVPA